MAHVAPIRPRTLHVRAAGLARAVAPTVGVATVTVTVVLAANPVTALSLALVQGQSRSMESVAPTQPTKPSVKGVDLGRVVVRLVGVVTVKVIAELAASQANVRLQARSRPTDGVVRILTTTQHVLAVASGHVVAPMAGAVTLTCIVGREIAILESVSKNSCTE